MKKYQFAEKSISLQADMNKKLYIETYGCQMNVRDSEAVGALLDAAGYEGS